MSAENGPCSWKTGEGRDYVFREPTRTEGARLWKMAHDVASPSSCKMLAGHFADSCVIAERQGKTAGFVSAFVRPASPDIVFIWQIAVSERERGHGLGRRLLHQLLSQPACRQAQMLEAAVTRSNLASRALFGSVARDLDVPFQVGQGLESSLFPDGVAESEDLVRVGPLPQAGLEGDDGDEPSHDQFTPKPHQDHRDRPGGHRSA